VNRPAGRRSERSPGRREPVAPEPVAPGGDVAGPGPSTGSFTPAGLLGSAPSPSTGHDRGRSRPTGPEPATSGHATSGFAASGFATSGHAGAAPDRAPSSGGPAADRRPDPLAEPRRVRMSIGVKLTALTGGLLIVLVVSSVLLIGQVRATSDAYQGVIVGQGGQVLRALQLQVTFKKQVQEWKDILLRGANPADLATYTRNFQAEDVAVSRQIADLIASTPDPAQRGELVKFRDAHRQLDGEYARALTAFTATGGRNPGVADGMVRGLDRPPTALLDGVVAQLQGQITVAVTRQQAQADSRYRATLVIGAGVLLVLMGVLALAVLGIVRPVRRLTREAFAAATDRLPTAIRAARTSDPRGEPPALPPFQVSTSDELRGLADALTTLQDSALNLAVQQHRAERETADMLVNLGRRNQNLLGRMLGYVTELERREQDPEVLSQLFRLDHATTRIRRNAESMLVLAGATQTRTWSRPVPVIDVVRAALSEIEDYTRVDLHHVEDGLVIGTAVADVVHLIAELVENATHFSPPTTQVSVVGQSVREGYRLRVIDQGVGMTQRELDEANQRVHRADTGWSDTKLLGLHVVGRLARRRDIQVVLEASAGRGITASVLLPAAVLSSRAESAAEAERSGVRPPRQAPAPVPALAPVTSFAALSSPGAPMSLSSAGAPMSGTTPAGGRAPMQAGAGRPAPAASAPPAVTVDLRDGGTDREDGRSGYPARRRSGSAGSAGSGGDDTPVAGMPFARPGHLAPLEVPAPVAAVPATHPVVPRRVRGAQLPDLGPGPGPEPARPDEGPGAPDSLRWQLRSFQLDVQAARRAIAETAGDDLPGHPDPTQLRPEGER